jgi:hypothetical protein
MRHRLKALILASLATFTLGALASATASAEVSLPEFKTETRSTGTGGKAELTVEGASYKCGSSTGEGIPLSKKAGTATIFFKECKGPVTIGKCWTLGDKPGEILVGGEAVLVRSTKGEKEPLVWVLLSKEDKEEAGGLKPEHLECEKVVGLALIWGNFLMTVRPFETKTKEFSGVVEREGEKQRITRFENNEGREVEAEGLKTSIDGGTPRSEGVESLTNSITTEKETELIG